MKSRSVRNAGWVGAAIAIALAPSVVLAEAATGEVASRTSALDWLLYRGAPATAPSGEQRLWLSDDGLFELSLRDGGAIFLRPRAPQPYSTGTTGTYAAADGHDLVLRVPATSALSVGLSAGLGESLVAPCPVSVGTLCLESTAGLVHSQPLGRVGAGVAGNQWRIDLSYARSRLTGGDLDHVSINRPWWSLGERPGPGSITAGDLRGDQLGLSGRFGLPGVDRAMLGLRVAQWRSIPGPWSDEFGEESATFSFGLTRGALSGEISSRWVHSEPLGQSYYWGGLDLGVSWRMPWQGEFQFGARNLLTRTQQPVPPASASGLDEARARTPYVRYHQDF